jgi:hypothetical protein
LRLEYRSIDILTGENLLIFCQSPSDVKYLLSIYNNYRGYNLSIFVINVRSIYDFLVSLQLNVVELKFIEYNFVDFKNPISILREKIRIRKLKSLYLNYYQNVNVIFFSRFEDWLTSSFILYFLLRSEKVFYLNHYDDAISSSNVVSEEARFSRRVLGLILKYVTGVNFLMTREFRYPEFPVSRYEIIELKPTVDPKIYTQYSVNFEFQNFNTKKVLFFISPPDVLMYNIDYYNNLSWNIINILINWNYKVYIKGHPRLGLPTFLQNLKLDKWGIEVLPEGIPGDFIDFDHFEFCLGIDSTILPMTAEKQIVDVLCLINLFEYKEESIYNEIKEYLLFLSPYLLKYINSLEDLELYLREKDND